MNICVFDTETTSLDKPFCYNVGYVIMNEKGETLLEKDFVVEQIWHNLPLFLSAYYASKRPLYVSAMRSRKATLKKFGYICQEMLRDFSNFEVEYVYAYNSSFDEKVFAFNCDWFKCSNPLDTVPVLDIRGNVHNFIADNDFFSFCDNNNYYTESGNYSSTAETVFRYITGDIEWCEEHTALADACIEASILNYTTKKGATLGTPYKVLRSLIRHKEKTLHIQTPEQTDFYFDYSSIRINKDKTEIVLK